MQTNMTATRVLWTVVLGHFLVTVVHGAAHRSAAVPMTPAANAFIVLVIIAGPFVGLALSHARPGLGAAIVVATMSAALVFGLANHFLIDGSDHVTHIAEPSRRLFGSTAVLLAITEMAAIAAGVFVVRRRT
jgi:hypothetical protein